MQIRWEVEDGYVGGSRPHYLNLDEYELAECETEEEVNQYLREILQEDFDNKIYPYIKNEDECLIAWEKVRKEFLAEQEEENE